MDLRAVARLGLLPLLFVACTADLSVPADAKIACDATDECPSDYVCLVSIRLCVRKDGDVTLPYIQSSSVVPTRATRGSVVTVTLDADSVQAAPPVVTLTWNGDSPGSAKATYASLSGASYVYTYTVGDAEPEGPLALHAELLSVVGVPNTYDQPNVLELDFAAPVLVADTSSITLPATPLLAAPTAAGLGTTITARFAVNETLADALTVSATTPADIAFVCDPPLGTFYTCRFVVGAAGITQGNYTLVADVTDRAGNPARLTIGTFALDTVAPAAPLVATPNMLTLQRAPHGTSTSGGVPRLAITAAAGALEPGVFVIAYDGPDVANAVLIARGTAEADGSLPGFVLPGVDRKTVYLQAVDAAGNGSTPVRVLDGAWTATLGGKVSGNSFGNPNRLIEQLSMASARDSVLSEPASPTLLSTSDGQSLITYGGPAWTLGPQTADHPSNRGDCRMTYDSINGRHVFFGGFWQTYNTGPVASDETWTFDGFNWRQVFSDKRPPGRAGHGMAFDKSRAVTVVFGGCTNDNTSCTNRIGDTWTFDGEIWTRACWPGCTVGQCTCDAMPSPRTNTQMFWDDARGEVVLFGGNNGADLNDMWSWNGTTWTQLSPAHKPAARSRAQVATDAAHGVTLLAGPSGDTWVWQNGDWSQASTSGAQQGQAWYDEATQQFISYNPNGSVRSTWTGNGWDTVFGSATLTGASMALSNACGSYSPMQKGFVWFGGCASGCRNDSGAVDTTHIVRQPATAEQLTLGTFPLARAYAAATALPGGAKAFVIGGKSPSAGNSYDGSWAWDGLAWTLTGTEDVSSGSRGRSGMALSPVSNTWLVRIGGSGFGSSSSVDTYWSSDGASWSWWTGSNAATLYNEPYTGTHLLDEQMTYRPGVGGILYRGTKTSSTWVATYVTNYTPWQSGGSTTGILWTPQSPTVSPTSTSRHGFTYCANAGGALLFGGYNGSTYLDETWLFTNGNWQQLSPERKPSPRGYHAMFCDSGRGNVFVVGGTNGSQTFDDVWEWDGSNWNDRTPARRPQAREGAAMTYVPALGRGVLFGGRDSSVFNDTWVWDGGSSSAPAHTFFAQFDEADVWQDASLVSVDATWVSGGTGYTAGGAQNGAALYVWDHGQWLATAVTNAATSDAPAPLTWSTSTDSEWSAYDATTRATRLHRLFTGIEHGVSFAVSPRGTNRSNPTAAVLASDYVEVTVHYRQND